MRRLLLTLVTILLPSTSSADDKPNVVYLLVDKAQVMLCRVNSDGFQRLQIELLRIPGIRFQDDLQLIVLL